MPCKVKIKENVESFVDKYSQRGLSMSLQDANKLASNINAKMKYHVVNFYNDGGKVARTINVPSELVDRYFDIEVKRRTPVTTDINIPVKEGVQELFNSNTELANIGTLQEYSQYLNTIFPDSKVKDIVYHGSNNKNITKFLKPNSEGWVTSDYVLDTTSGIFFTQDIKTAKSYAKPFKDGTIYNAVLNVKNPYNQPDFPYLNKIKYQEFGSHARPNEKAYKIRNLDASILTLKDPEKNIYFKEIGVFEPEQIHILGNKQDIEGFKNFVDNKPSVSANKFELDVKNLNLTPEVVNYLYQDSRAKSQGRDIENYKREISKIINNLQSDFTNSEILETLKCI